MILERGEKVFIVTRRRFESDLRRHFVGIVEDCDNECIKASGYVFVMDGKNQFVRRPERRIRIFSLVDGIHIINIISHNTHLEKVKYVFKESRLTITDGKNLSLDVDEFKMI
jgi:hypothetical protein